MISEKLIEDFLHPFGEGKISIMLTIAMEMQSFGLTATEVIEICKTHMKQRQEGMVAAENLLRKIPPSSPAEPAEPKNEFLCPDCRQRIIIRPVNVSKCTNIGGGWKTSLECINEKCRYTELSKKSLQEWRI
jgi:predicted RNA-binding Zn-ribbon protein involved in translation (DUF1610 family)